MASPYELLVRFNRDGSVAGAHTRSIETVGDRDFELDPVPLAESDDAFARFAEQFAAAAVAERDSLKTELAETNQQLSERTSQRDQCEQQLATERDQFEKQTAECDSLKTEFATQRDQFEQQLATLTAERDSIRTEIAALESRVVTLRANQRFNPRVITSDAFFERITKRELSLMAASADPNVIAIGSLLNQYDDQDWRVELDSDELIQPLSYLIAVGMLTEARAIDLRRDGIESEAYQG